MLRSAAEANMIAAGNVRVTERVLKNPTRAAT